jgi:hypothetical protein
MIDLFLTILDGRNSQWPVRLPSCCLQFYSDYSSVRISPARTNAANAHRVEAKELGDDGKKKEKKTTDKLKEVAGKAITAISMARGTDVDTNERLTARVFNQLQTIFMFLPSPSLEFQTRPGRLPF